ncbi:MAG: restriction endonuclease subunit S [Candidatus Omnitrophica bacterium]|nr:restriction endonuclease subunit S [Candidatus Omnitrophota bacterium]
MKLKQYPKYKDSDLPWVERIPEHWDVLPNRAVFEERNTRGMDQEELLSVTIKRGVIRQKELIESSSKKDSSNEDKSKYKLVLEGDLPYNKMRMWQGAVGISRYRGIVSPAYIILKPRENACSEYFHYLLRTTEYTKESHRYSYGICDDQLSLRFTDFKVIKSIVPSFDEQRFIASFLRSKEKKIAQFIRNKRRLIQLLKEQKQAIINQAVTRGINPDVKMKPSGVDWMGDIPDQWEVRRLKYLVSINKNVLSENADKNYEFSYLDIGSVGTGCVVKEPEKMCFKNAPFCSTGFAVLTPKNKIIPSLLGLLMQSDNFLI